MITTITKAITRNDFGAILTMPDATLAIANTLLNKAIVSGKLDEEYNDMARHKRHGWIGWCLTYSIYDVTHAAVLVQRRETERTKYGSNAQKSYYVVRRCGKGVTVTEASKARVAKLAKIAHLLGDVIDTLEGRAKKPLKLAAPFSEKDVAYKIVEARDGSYYSVYDENFEWTLGKARIEAATDSHDGGYYVFPTVASAKSALANNVVFQASWQDGKTLVLVECEVSGRRYRHDNGKLCVTFCRPVQVLERLTVTQYLQAA